MQLAEGKNREKTKWPRRWREDKKIPDFLTRSGRSGNAAPGMDSSGRNPEPRRSGDHPEPSALHHIS